MTLPSDDATVKEITVENNFWEDWTERFLEAAASPWVRTLVQLQDTFYRSTANFYHEQGIPALFLPITTGSISSPMGLGSDSSPVKISYGGVDTYLADSMQFMLEYGCRVSPPGVYYLMPSFRGESPDERHLSQYFHSEAEIPGGLHDVQTLIEKYVRCLSADILASHADSISTLAGGVAHIEALLNKSGSTVHISVEEAAKVLRDKHPHEDAVGVHEFGFESINPKGEHLLMEELGQFIWLERSDARSVPFYQASAGDGKTTLNSDFLFGIGEIVGCGERHADGHSVRAALADHNVPVSGYEWYVRMKDETPLQTAGFGMGVERYLAWVLNCNDIRAMQIVPRAIGKNLLP